MSENVVIEAAPAVKAEPTVRDRLGMPSLVTASTISNVGNGITFLAIPWFVLVTTGSAARTGIVGGVSAAAVVLSGTLGGAAVDRLGFKATSIVSDVASMITVALIPMLYWLDVLEFWMLLVLVFLGAIFDAPGGASRRAMIPRLASRSRTPLERANAAMELGTNVSNSLLGPIAAGLLIGIMGEANVLYIDALTFLAAIVIIGLFVPLPLRSAPEVQVDGTGMRADSRSYLADLLEGFRFAWQDTFLRVVMPISMLYNFLFAPMFTVILPVFARDEFDSAGALGLMVGSFGAGAAVGTIAFGVRGHRVGRYATFITAVVGIAIGFWIVTVSTALWITVIGMIVIGLAIGPTNALSMVIMQTRVPETMLGRVMGLMFAMSAVATPAGVFAGGFVVDATSFRFALIIGAIGVTFAALWVILSRSVRELAKELDAGRGVDSESVASA